MQYVMNFGAPSPLQRIRNELVRHFGRMRPRMDERPGPLDQLIRSLLGCKTLDEVSWAAFERLKHRCGGWEHLQFLRTEDVLEHARPVEYAEDKARHLLQAIDKIVAERGSLDLGFLTHCSVDEALKWLMSLPGVGPKVAAATLNFSVLRRRTFVVDTHVWRVCQRLGLIGAKVDARDSA